MGKRHQYVGVVYAGNAIALSGPTVIVDTVCAAVKFTGDGRIVKRGTAYRKGDEPKNLAATAARMAKPWQSYFERTGKRWELELDAKRKAKMDKRKEEDRRKVALRNAAPELLERLRALTKAVRFAGVEDPDVKAELLKADAITSEH